MKDEKRHEAPKESGATGVSSSFRLHPSSFPPPWQLTGSAALFLSARGAIMLVHYESSPVGPYEEWARCVMTRRRPRVVEMMVTSPDSMRAGRENWGFPKQLASLKWQRSGARIEFRAENEVYRLRVCGQRLLLRVNFFCVQTLDGKDVRVPFELAGAVRLAWRGRQIALIVEDFRMKVSAPQALCG